MQQFVRTMGTTFYEPYYTLTRKEVKILCKVDHMLKQIATRYVLKWQLKAGQESTDAAVQMQKLIDREHIGDVDHLKKYDRSQPIDQKKCLTNQGESDRSYTRSINRSYTRSINRSYTRSINRSYICSINRPENYIIASEKRKKILTSI